MSFSQVKRQSRPLLVTPDHVNQTRITLFASRQRKAGRWSDQQPTYKSDRKLARHDNSFVNPQKWQDRKAPLPCDDLAPIGIEPMFPKIQQTVLIVSGQTPTPPSVALMEIPIVMTHAPQDLQEIQLARMETRKDRTRQDVRDLFRDASRTPSSSYPYMRQPWENRGIRRTQFRGPKRG